MLTIELLRLSDYYFTKMMLSNMRRKLLSLGLTFLMSSYLSISAQYMKDGYVSYGKGGNYGNVFRVSSYTNDDENFFISRVKPKARFTDKSTQVNQDFVNWCCQCEPQDCNVDTNWFWPCRKSGRVAIYGYAKRHL